jgi:proteasome lid subunit RPN8/RPN11
MFGHEVNDAARTHAAAEFPKEACGIVIGGKYQPISNVAAEPMHDFEMSGDAWTSHGNVQAVVHSHGPESALAPSANDMRHQISTNVPWGITRTDGAAASPVLWWGDFRLDEPLIGRHFIHGVTDCYSAIRSWRWQNCQIKLPDFPRNDLWWTADEDLYNEGFPRAGYRVVPESEAAVGDVALINFRSKVPNHGGTLVEDGLLFHHLQNRLSCREPVGRWRSMITKWLRYEG